MKQIVEGIFIHQEGYTKDQLKKYNKEHGPFAKFLIAFVHKIFMDIEGEPIYQKTYRGMIGSLLDLITSRMDIMFFACLCV